MPYRFDPIAPRSVPRIVLMLMLATLSLAAQERLTGLVYDADTRAPLRGAEVYLDSLRVGTVTDEDGYFELRLPALPPGDTLVVSYIGYRTFRTALGDFRGRRPILLKSVGFAQDSVTVSARRIDVVAQEIPHARTVIGFEEIELRGGSEISDLFKSLPSVRIEGNDVTGRKVQIRGSDPNEVNVYIDGIPINNLGIDNAADLSLIALDNVESVEVLKGANLTLLGGGAFGGVVNVRTRRNLEREVLVKTLQGSFDSQQYVVGLNLPASPRLVFNYFGQLNGIKPGIEFLPSEERDPEKTGNEQVETIRQNHNLGMRYYGAAGEFSLRAYGYVMDYEKPLLRNDRENLLVATGYQGRIGAVDDIDIRINYLYGDDTIEQQEQGTPRRFFTTLRSGNIDARLLKRFTFNGNELQLQGQYFHDELDREQNQESVGTRVRLYDAFLYENRWAAAGVAAFRNAVAGRDDLRWKTHLGLRSDILATGDAYVSPTIGAQIEWEHEDWLITPYASFGKNVKFPTLRDNALAAVQSRQKDPDDPRPRPIIDSTLTRFPPEISRAFEVGAGADYAPANAIYESVGFAVAGFRTTVIDKLLRHPFRPLQILTTSGRNTTTGMEVSASMERLFGHVGARLSGTLLDIEVPLFYPYKPETAASLQLDYRSGFGLFIGTTLFYQGESVGWTTDPGQQIISSDDVRTESIPAYQDMDVTLGYRFRLGGARFNLQGSVYNVFDQSEYQFYLLGKRNVQVALSIRY